MNSYGRASLGQGPGQYLANPAVSAGQKHRFAGQRKETFK
jgi:hypothetical protein